MLFAFFFVYWGFAFNDVAFAKPVTEINIRATLAAKRTILCTVRQFAAYRTFVYFYDGLRGRCLLIHLMAPRDLCRGRLGIQQKNALIMSVVCDDVKSQHFRLWTDLKRVRLEYLRLILRIGYPLRHA